MSLSEKLRALAGELRILAPVTAKELTRHAAEAEALERDAARYRWIRDKSQFGTYKTPTMLAYCPETPDLPLLVGDALDAAIDAAMKEGK